MDKEVRFRTRVFKNNGDSKDYIGISINRSPMVARIERDTPSKYVSRLQSLHPHSALYENISSLDEVFPIVAVGFEAYHLFCRTEVEGEEFFHDIDDWSYISYDDFIQKYLDLHFSDYLKNHNDLYHRLNANGELHLFMLGFLSELYHKEKKLYSETKKLSRKQGMKVSKLGYLPWGLLKRIERVLKESPQLKNGMWVDSAEKYLGITRATRTRMIKRGKMPRGKMFYTVDNIIQALIKSRKWVNIKL
jgi:hypothetical protein